MQKSNSRPIPRRTAPINDWLRDLRPKKKEKFIPKEKRDYPWWCRVCWSTNVCPACGKCRNCGAGGEKWCLVCKQYSHEKLEVRAKPISKELFEALQKNDNRDKMFFDNLDVNSENIVLLVKVLRLQGLYVNDIAIFLSEKWFDDDLIAKALVEANYNLVNIEDALLTLWIPKDRIDEIMQGLQNNN